MQKEQIYKDTLKHLEKLIAINSVSENSNLEKIAYIESVLKPLGYSLLRDYDSTKQKANLWASIGDVEKSGIALSGHTDVVPSKGQKWTKEPFCLTLSENKAYGRGTTDMQSFLALMLSFAPFYKKLQLPVHFCFSYDEEVGCLGIRELAKNFHKVCPVLPKMCFIGEPTEFTPVIAHKGKTNLTLEVRGLECHSAYLEKGINAITESLKVLDFFLKLGAENKKIEENKKIKENKKIEENKKIKNELFFTPYSSYHLGTIKGGTKANIIARDCVCEFEIRAIDKERHQENLKKIEDFVFNLNENLKKKHPASFAKIKIDDYPSFSVKESSPICQLAKKWTQKEFGKADYATEASIFAKLGIPSLVVGPGNIEQAHKPDEYITKEQLKEGVDFLCKMHQYFLD